MAGETESFFEKSLAPFYHGVASGDPTSRELVIWTRVTPEYEGEIELSWKIALDSLQKKIVQKGVIKTDHTRDYTVKQLVSGLQPGRYYWYSFAFNGKTSVVGRTKTLPENPDSIRLVVISCNAYEAGYFNAFQAIGDKKEKIDAVVHLGDYIYEGFSARFIELSDRIPLPKKELVTLLDYRTRYAQYRLDAQLRYAHQRHPFIHIWDDHEIANDAYQTGAQGHNPEEEGDFEERKKHARKAFYEWVAIKDQPALFRKVSFGELAELFLLDGRLEGRTEQMAPTERGFTSPDRRLLGQRQSEWLIDGLTKTKATWKLIGNPVLFAEYNFSPVIPNIATRKADNWSGYPGERNEVLSSFSLNSIRNILFLSGDSHCSWAFEIPDPFHTTKPIAVEVGVPSISSGNWDSGNPLETVLRWEKELYAHPENQDLEYVNLRDHGYVEVVIFKDQVQCFWHYVNKDSHEYMDQVGKSCVIPQGANQIILK
ncbi:MAG: alkaline phosphatase D family protein [Haliscomenobacter sp.]|nr:alkaline phosphatase D family protein [Haliscomenobacter sp.]